MKKEMNNKGFSLVELIIVIAIMAVLVGVLAPQYLKYVKNSKISTDITNAESIATAINVAVSDDPSQIQASSGAAISGGTTLVSDGSRVVTAPTSKVNASYTWVINWDSTNGVTGITLGNKNIWPTASDFESANK
ncbi:MAG: prepilin-type N-terminal cleavage/methylation domain-containing protein [Muribaculum sp.]|nr:prepilin-type N-terminal cleavage/methylation domain-containing protein [Muribaculum sp.]